MISFYSLFKKEKNNQSIEIENIEHDFIKE